MKTLVFNSMDEQTAALFSGGGFGDDHAIKNI